MRYIHELPASAGIEPENLLNPGKCAFKFASANRVNILALGDVGATTLIGLRLLGSDVISEIGIMDIRPENLERLEMEINQIGYPFGMQQLPPVFINDEEHLFDCDVLIFCASRGVPPVSADGNSGRADVRMAQLDANREIINHYAGLAQNSAFKGMVAIVSDPVDNLAAAFLDASGLEPWQIQGYGLGVMNMRALYYSNKLSATDCSALTPEETAKISLFASEGRVFGPHGQDLVVANSIKHYDDAVSRMLTKHTVEANLKVRELGFKPYIAPAISSAALSILLTLRGEWHYGSVYMGNRREGAFMGIRNRVTSEGIEYEDACVPGELFDRILIAYRNLCNIR